MQQLAFQQVYEGRRLLSERKNVLVSTQLRACTPDRQRDTQVRLLDLITLEDKNYVALDQVYFCSKLSLIVNSQLQIAIQKKLHFFEELFHKLYRESVMFR